MTDTQLSPAADAQRKAMNWLRERAKTDDRVDSFLDTLGKMVSLNYCGITKNDFIRR